MTLNQIKEQYDAVHRLIESARRNGDWQRLTELHLQAQAYAFTISIEIKKLKSELKAIESHLEKADE